MVESRGRGCRVRRHEVGLRLYLWELLPDRDNADAAVSVTAPARAVPV